MDSGITGRAIRSGSAAARPRRSLGSRLRRGAPGHRLRARDAASLAVARSSASSTSSPSAHCPTARSTLSVRWRARWRLSPRRSARAGRSTSLRSQAVRAPGQLARPPSDRGSGAASSRRSCPSRQPPRRLGRPRHSSDELAAWRADDASRPGADARRDRRRTRADRPERRLSGARRRASRPLGRHVRSSGCRSAQTRGSSVRSSDSTGTSPVSTRLSSTRRRFSQRTSRPRWTLRSPSQRERQSAVTDALTGILNRRGLEELLDRALASRAGAACRL